MRTRSRAPDPFQLGIFWLGIQVVWGALLAISLQARTSALGGAAALLHYGEIATAGAMVAAVTQIVVGPVADARRAHGDRRIAFYAAGAVAAAVGIWWFYAAGTFGGLLAAFMLVQCAMNVAIGPYQSVIPDFVETRRIGAASSWMAALQSLGNAAGAIVASFVSSGRAIAGILILFLLATCAATVRHVSGLEVRGVIAARLRITRTFVDLFVSRAFIYVGFYTLLGYVYFYVAHAMPGPLAAIKSTSGIILLLFTVVGALGAAASSGATDRSDKRLVVTIAGGGFVAGLLAFLLGQGIVAMYLGTLVAGFAWGAFLTADWALGCALLPRSALAAGMGVWNLAIILPQIVAPAVTTLVLFTLHAATGGGGPRIAFGLAALEVLAGVAWTWRLPASGTVKNDVIWE